MMSFIAIHNSDWDSWDYIQGDLHGECGSLAVDRYYHIMDLVNQKEDLQLALRTKDNKWTKWKGFYQFPIDSLMNAYEVHRGLLDNEIVIESDYPDYKDNYDAARFIGTLLESKGYIPHYYFSGSKSLHIHLFINYKLFTKLPMDLQDKLYALWKTKETFLKHFTKFIRHRLITQWGMNEKDFDQGLVQGTHLIRSELSRNKLGYKTFLGYTHFDVPPLPYVCNEVNRIYPQLGKIRLSEPDEFEQICRDFLESRKKKKQRQYKGSLTSFFEKDLPILPCAKWLLSDEFCVSRDGRNRAMFILINELKRVHGEELTRTILLDWVERTDANITPQEIEYRISKSKNYSIGKTYVHAFLRELGFMKCGGCNETFK